MNNNINPRPYPNCACEKEADTYYCDADHSRPETQVTVDVTRATRSIWILDDED